MPLLMAKDYTLKLDVQTPAKVAGIHNANQLAKACDLHNGPAYLLWSGQQTRFNLETLTSLVNALHCDLSDILIRVRTPKPIQAQPSAVAAPAKPLAASPQPQQTTAGSD